MKKFDKKNFQILLGSDFWGFKVHFEQKKFEKILCKIFFIFSGQYHDMGFTILISVFWKKQYRWVPSGDFFEMTQWFYRAKPKKNSIHVGEYLKVCLNHALTMLWLTTYFIRGYFFFTSDYVYLFPYLWVNMIRSKRLSNNLSSGRLVPVPQPHITL